MLDARRIGRIVHAAELHIRHACSIDGREGRTGLVLCAADKDGTIFSCLVGTVPDQEALIRFHTNCLEKVNRLLVRPNDISAWLSRDFDGRKYGGGVRAPDGTIFAASGLSEYADEAFSSVVAHNSAVGFGLDAWNAVQQVSGNPHMNTLGHMVKDRTKAA